MGPRISSGGSRGWPYPRDDEGEDGSMSIHEMVMGRGRVRTSCICLARGPQRHITFGRLAGLHLRVPCIRVPRGRGSLFMSCLPSPSV